ncbi:hypothetical protein M436DRAFT_69815 [Aureobasidium namibiae CBS 147.97]|uniref:Small secreted protein n=1 Tax=Aureobasidium namibiae CBS 147.97 TaxID=1043004 RepID=A0A074WUM5_9PEZI|nr:uncharacterized protein M436DRAFT_69815 [Aureobasidium namibiae CBS 147.97]KEQ76878.1 hypothetical protein M436DRAFT_69815 [Aureobasidium namibiae CBS 147.97]
MTSLILLLAFILHLVTQITAQSLNVSTLAVQNGSSILECWSLNSPTSGAGAQNYPLGDFSEAFIGAIPPHTYIGLVHISLPNSKDEIYIQPGPLSVLLVIDQRNVSITGHITDFPGSETTLIAQFPVSGNLVPAHTVLHSGPCGLDDVRGLIG